MNTDKVEEIMSKVLSKWDDRFGVENCSAETVFYTYQTLLLSPHEDGCMPVQLIGGEQLHKIPMEEIILFGLKGEEVEQFKIKR